MLGYVFKHLMALSVFSQPFDEFEDMYHIKGQMINGYSK